jgi:hypothetical protein
LSPLASDLASKLGEALNVTLPVLLTSNLAASSPVRL